MFFIVLQRLFIELILDIFYFPIWWYTEGSKRFLFFCFNLIKGVYNLLAPGLWLKNIFVPMFGQSDLQGRLVSFLVRFFNFIFRSLIFIIWIIVVIALFILWVVFPIFILFMLFVSFFSIDIFIK